MIGLDFDPTNLIQVKRQASSIAFITETLVIFNVSLKLLGNIVFYKLQTSKNEDISPDFVRLINFSKIHL